MRLSLLSAVFLTTLVSVGWELAYGGEIYVIANPTISLTSKDIREIYIGEMEFSGDVRLLPVDNKAARSEFVVKVLVMNPERYETLWAKKAFRDALAPPAVKATEAEVLEFVRRTRGAVGYVSSAPRGNDVTVVGKF